MGLVSALKSVQKLSQQELELEKQILRIQKKANIVPGIGKFLPNSLQTVAEKTDQFVPSTRETAKKVGQGLKQKFTKWLEQFVETAKRTKGM